MPKLNYGNLFSEGKRWGSLKAELQSVKSECLQHSANSFNANISRVTSFALMPAIVAFEVRKDCLCEDNALIRAGLMKVMTLDERSALTVSENVVMDAAANKISFHLDRKEWHRFVSQQGIGFISYAIGDQEEVPQAFRAVYAGLSDSMRTIFSTVILSAWTAFECLASDLWKAAIDNAPPEIVNRAIEHATAQKPDSISPTSAYVSEFDVRKQPGSWLLDMNRYSFPNLDKIKQNYGVVFGKECKNLFKSVADGYIRALYAVRNVLTHNAGIADKKFIGLAQGIPELTEIGKGELVRLDGDLVRKLSFASLELGNALIKHVDDLLSAA